MDAASFAEVLIQNSQMSLNYRKFDAQIDGSQGLLLNPFRLTRALATDFAQVIGYWQAVKYLVLTKLTVRYQRSVLGFCWMLLNPLCFLMVTAIIFSTIRNRPLATFTIYLFAGLIPYRFFSTAITAGAVSFVKNQSMIRKTFIPRLIFPLTDMITQLVNTMLAMLVLFFILIPFGARLHPQLVMLPVALMAIISFTFGMMLIAMVLNTYFRDVEHILGSITRLLFFATPILWEPARLIGKSWYFEIIVYGNPLTYFVRPFQDMFRFGQWTDMRTWMIIAALSITSPIIGFITYKKHEHKLIFRL